MSWEVPTTMSKTSYFNVAVFKRNLTGFWPLWAVYMIILLLVVPMTLFSRLSIDPRFLTGEDVLSLGASASLFTIFIFSIVSAMAFFSYLYSARSAVMTASLPISRSCMFITNFISGLVWLISAQVIAALVTIIIELSFGISCLTLSAIGQWLLMSVMQSIFFFGFASFCAMLTGNLVVLPILYFIFNFLFIALYYVLSSIFELFLLGYAANVPGIIHWLTPVTKLFQSLQGGHISASGWIATGVYTLAGLIFAVLSLVIYRRHRMESASDVVAVRPLRPVAKVCTAIGLSFTLGLVIYLLIFSTTAVKPVGLAICFIIGGFVGYFAADMLISKSFKVFHRYKGFLVYAVVVAAFVACLEYDVMGYEDHIPPADKVKEAVISLNGEKAKFTSNLSIEQVAEVHEDIINSMRAANTDPYAGFNSVTITYKFSNGSTLNRRYYCTDETIPSELTDMFNSYESRYDRIALDYPPNPQQVVYATVDVYADNNYASLELTGQQFCTLYDYLIQDLYDSSLGSINSFSSDTSEPEIYLFAELESTYEAGDTSYTYECTIPVDALKSTEYINSLLVVN